MDKGTSQQKFIFSIVALVGLGILVGDVRGDLAFFQGSGAPTSTSLILSAVVRNILTLVALLALFLNHRFGAYLLMATGSMGLWRRLSYFGPLLGAEASGPEFLLVHSGADLVFRTLLLGLGLGWFLGRRSAST